MSYQNLKAKILDFFIYDTPRALAMPAALALGHELKSRHPFRFGSIQMLQTAFQFVAHHQIKGDYAEFGVFEGKTFAAAFHCAKYIGLPNMNFHAFDSFEGLPEIAGQDLNGSFHSGEFSASKMKFLSWLKRRKVNLNRVKITEGFFDHSLASENSDKIGLENIAVAWIDCDLYESTKPVLDYLTDRLADGAVIIFDDWFCFKGKPNKGEQLACSEWLEKNKHITLIPYQTFNWAGNSFIVNRKAEP